MATARPATVALLLAVLAAAHGCGGDDATGTMVVIEPEVGLVMPMDQLRVVAVGRDASDAPHAAERTYPIAGTGTTWPQSIVVLAGLKASAGVEVLVIGLKDAVEVARGGAVVTFAPGAIVTATVTLRAACRGVYCAERSFCGADGQCPPAVRRLDFAVNASGRHDQTSPTVASLGAGGWVMAWANEAVDPAQVYLRRFASDGAPRDARDHQVAPSSRRQGAPVLAAAPGADAFVVGWAEADAGRVMVRRFDASGQPLGAADEPAGAGGGSQGAPTLGANPAGFVVAWQDTESPTGAGTSVRFRRGAWPAGWLDPAVASAATDPRGAEQRPTACGSCGGGETFLVAWQDTSQADPDPSGTQIRGRWVTGSPATGGEAVLDTTTAGDQINPAAASSGALGVVVWEDRGVAPPVIRGRMCGPDSPQLTPELTVASTSAALAAARPAVGVAGDVALIVWEAVPADDPDGVVVLGRRIHRSGLPVDPEPFIVAPRRLGNQQQPRAAGADRDFAVVWQEHDAAGAGWEVRGRILGAADAP